MVSNRVFTFLLSAVVLLATAGPSYAGLTAEQVLGQDLYFEAALSLNGNQSCATCHDPATGFVDPDNTSTLSPVSLGSDGASTGGRNAPSAAYAAFSPFFRWDDVAGLYVGGQFWDGRANTLAGQAAGPPLNPVEMALASKRDAITNLSGIAGASGVMYQDQFLAVYGIDLGSAATNLDDGAVIAAYDAMAKAIGEFEKTRMFSKFNSKYDYVLAGLDTLTPREQRGLRLFNRKGKCALCHLNQPSLAPDGTMMPPLFTDFTYDNLGVPKNFNIEGVTVNSLPDDGLGGRADIAANDPAGAELGKFKVMTLRNIALTPPYAHNGVFVSLQEIVHFYNTRDVLPACPQGQGNLAPGFGITCWPEPEQPLNVNAAELGNLLLTPAQEARIVAFLMTLTDRDPVAFPSPFFPNYSDDPAVDSIPPIPMP